jgi:hypothetical protein
MDLNDVWFRVKGTAKTILVTFLLVTVMPALKIFFVISPAFRRDMAAWSEKVFKDSPVQLNDPSLGVSWAMIKHIICSIRFLTFCCVNPGGKAYNSRLFLPDGKTQTRLFDYMQKGRPLVVNFGSCTSPAWMAKLEQFRQLMKDFADIATFVTVYIKEAHPTDGWKFHTNQYKVASHQCLQDRLDAAKNVEAFRLPCPLVIDPMDNNSTYAYAAASERLYIIQNGYCTFKGGIGPEDFRIDDVRQWLKYYAYHKRS